jgi:hypothetical protein
MSGFQCPSQAYASSLRLADRQGWKKTNAEEVLKRRVAQS